MKADYIIATQRRLSIFRKFTPLLTGGLKDEIN